MDGPESTVQLREEFGWSGVRATRSCRACSKRWDRGDKIAAALICIQQDLKEIADNILGPCFGMTVRTITKRTHTYIHVAGEREEHGGETASQRKERTRRSAHKVEAIRPRAWVPRKKDPDLFIGKTLLYTSVQWGQWNAWG
ncbi:hypothetical protein Trydic_g18019 [Trypoxylus dichotomus]